MHDTTEFVHKIISPQPVSESANAFLAARVPEFQSSIVDSIVPLVGYQDVLRWVVKMF